MPSSPPSGPTSVRRRRREVFWFDVARSRGLIELFARPLQDLQDLQDLQEEFHRRRRKLIRISELEDRPLAGSLPVPSRMTLSWCPPMR